MVRCKRGGVLPEFFKRYGDFDAIGRLGCVEMYVGGSGRGGHGDDLVGQLFDPMEHRCAMSRWKGEDEEYIDRIAEWKADG